MPGEVCVHIVDDDSAVRDSLAFLFRIAGFKPCPHSSAEAFLEGVATGERGCVVTDIRMPGMTGLDLLHEMNRRGVDMPVIVITGHGDVPLAVEAMKAGARDFIEKPFDDERLVASVRTVLLDAGEHGERDRTLERLSSLSPREREVLACLIEGQPNKVVAHILGISQRTVEIHRAHVMMKMEAASFAELVRAVVQAGPSAAELIRVKAD